MSRKLDTHDLSRGRIHLADTASDSSDPVIPAMKMIQQPCLVLGIQSDGLFTFAEQELLAATIPNAVLKTIDSPEGHDAFLLEFEQVNRHVLEFLKEQLPDIMAREPELEGLGAEGAGFEATRTSTFGEAEVDDNDITAW